MGVWVSADYCPLIRMQLANGCMETHMELHKNLYSVLYKYLIQIRQYQKCAVLSSMFDRGSFCLLWISV